MLFNSYAFMFIFLPIAVIGFYLIGGRSNHRLAMCWLVGVSFFFYAYWNPANLIILIASALFNYAFGLVLAQRSAPNGKVLLAIAIIINLIVLGYFKYMNFFLQNVEATGLIENDGISIAIPLGISFITFQKIAYLIDSWKKNTKEYSFLDFLLFISFFPQLIAGPIVHHRELMPQFRRSAPYIFAVDRISVGLTLFLLGLFKKVVLADTLGSSVDGIFSQAAIDGVGFTDAWCGAIAYTLQLYFDFSGYSDMASGLARLFGVRMPINFFSPYKATGIIEFWRRWHMTLSRFLLDHVYIPLGGNRRGVIRRHLNLMVTMLLGGLWHGAGWNFVVWGGLHGAYLIVNHVWRATLGHWVPDTRAFRVLAGLVTFIAVTVAWVFFRADSVVTALRIVSAMGDITHAGFPAPILATKIAMMLAVVWLAPNTAEIMRAARPFLLDRLRSPLTGSNWLVWRPNLAWSLALAAIGAVAVYRSRIELQFLYFQF